MGPTFFGARVGAVVAHQGGWDEVVLVAGPIVVIIVLLAIAKRRVDAHPALGGDDATPGGAGDHDRA